MPDNIKIVTFNLRHDADRWLERRKLVRAGLARENADVIALQEVALPIQQAQLIADDLNDELGSLLYQPYVQPKWSGEPEGIGFLSKLPVIDYGFIHLPEGGRVAQRIRVSKGGSTLDIINTHLHHLPVDDEIIRLPQANAILEWAAETSSKVENCRWVIMGDLNAQPNSSTINQFTKFYKSAYSTVHGKEPLCTFPTPLVAETGFGYQPNTIDYILFDPESIDVVNIRLIMTEPDIQDSTLYPSDHFGLSAEFTVK